MFCATVRAVGLGAALAREACGSPDPRAGAALPCPSTSGKSCRCGRRRCPPRPQVSASLLFWKRDSRQRRGAWTQHAAHGLTAFWSPRDRPASLPCASPREALPKRGEGMQESVPRTFPCSTCKWPSAPSGQGSGEQAVPGGSGLLPAGDPYSVAPEPGKMLSGTGGWAPCNEISPAASLHPLHL